MSTHSRAATTFPTSSASRPHARAVDGLAAAAGVVLGLLFVVLALNFFFHFFEMPAPPPDSPAGMFMGALVPSGYFAFVKLFEISGGLLVAIPATRRIGLVLLGPVIVNILCFHVFLENGAGLFPLPFAVTVLFLFLLWVERDALRALGPSARRSSAA